MAAVDTRDKLPFTVPDVVGVNMTVKVTLWPPVSVVGKFSPDTEKAEPVTLAWVMVTLAPPVFVTVSDRLPVLPT